MLRKLTTYILTKREKGQSLVEVALFFPIFLIILAGVVEVSHLAITQNRVSNAARVGSRSSSQGSSNADMVTDLLNSITQTLDAGPAVWDIWSFEGSLDAAGTNFTDWKFEHVYGLMQTTEYTTVNEADVKLEVLEELQLGDPGGAGNLEFVGTLAIHDVESILGIQAIPDLLGMNSSRALNVMRILPLDLDTTGGCAAFPIAVHEGVRSVHPPNTGTSNDYPNPGDFHSQSPKPTYTEIGVNNIPDIPLEDAHEGYLYKIQNGAGPGSFGWLRWNNGQQASEGTLVDSLTWPGDALNYENVGNCNTNNCPTPIYQWKVRGYVNAVDNMDLELNIDDWVWVNTGAVNSNAVRDQLLQHITKNRNLRVLVWGGQEEGSGQSLRFQIYGFAVFRLKGHNLAGNNSWILAEFVRWDTVCGQKDS